ncbi:AEC family transporter [Microbacteriaceae bacterium VKM Ac-2854]|nr:AEC family transporter [Microbacteriaceae bacterium VKM Ac-2854]
MTGVLVGFGTLAVVVAVGWLVARVGLIDAAGRVMLSKLVFSVATPLLLFQNLSSPGAELSVSAAFLVAGVSAVLIAVAYLLVARFAWRRPLAESVAGAMGASVANSTYLGIPISVYVLGDASYVAPLLFFQIIFFTPLLTTLLRMGASGAAPSARSILRAVFGNPVLIGALAGVIVGALGWRLPTVLSDPIGLIGAMAVPGALLAFGMSLHGSRPLGEREWRRDALSATALKLVLQPVLAWLLALALGLSGHALLAVVVCAALPTGQNVFISATAIGRGGVLTRDVVFLTTVGSVPVLLLVAGLLG